MILTHSSTYIHTCIQAAIGKAHITIQGGASNMANSAAMTANLVVSDSSLLPLHTYMHTYKHTYIHTYVHTYIHAFIRTYVRELKTNILYTHKIVIHTYIHTNDIHILYSFTHIQASLSKSGSRAGKATKKKDK